MAAMRGLDLNLVTISKELTGQIRIDEWIFGNGKLDKMMNGVN